MSDHRQAERPLAIGERRLHARIPVTPQAFVKFGSNNYGFVFNISENGLVFAPTGTLTLAVGAVARMRFQLPDSKEWIETSGEVVWIAESQREAGVRFVELMEDTRAKIRNWISQEPSRPDLPEAHDSVRNLIGASQTVTPGAVPEDKILKSIFADPGLFLVGSKSARAKPAAQPGPIVADEIPQAADASHIPERRSQPRRRVLSLEYLDLGDSNGGIILNLGEDGMYIQAVASLIPDHISNLSFRVPDLGYPVETSGNIVWVGESKKDAGIQFDNLPEEARLKIREWVAAEFPSRRDFHQSERPSATDRTVAKPAPDARTLDRLAEMPPSSSPKTPSHPDGAPLVHIPEKQTDIAAKSPRSGVPVHVSEMPAENGDRAAQKPADVPVVRVPPQQPDSAAKSSRAGVPPSVAQKPDDAGSAASKTPKPRAAEPPPVNVAQPQSRYRSALPPGTFTADAVVLTTDAPEPSSEASSSTNLEVLKSLGWKRVAAVLVVVVLISFVAGWIVAGPSGRKQILDKFVSPQTDRSSQPTENPAPTSTESNTAVPASSAPPTASSQPASKAPPRVASENVPAIAPEKSPVATQINPAAPSSAPPSASNVVAANNRSQQPAPPSAPPTSRAAAPSNSPSAASSSNPPSLAANNTSPPPVVTPPASNSPSLVAKNAPPPAHTDSSSPSPANASPPVSPPTPAAEIVKGTVSVNASPFPSIRVPPELKSQISKQGASLQIGQLISRVEPVYPEDAQHQRIEGVVKLHAIIARDGSIQDIDQMSGPPLLVAAAANAIRQWRYKPTSLDGQPVEATEAITVTFRLQSARAN